MHNTRKLCYLFRPCTAIFDQSHPQTPANRRLSLLTRTTCFFWPSSEIRCESYTLPGYRRCVLSDIMWPPISRQNRNKNHRPFVGSDNLPLYPASSWNPAAPDAVRRDKTNYRAKPRQYITTIRQSKIARPPPCLPCSPR